MSASPGKECSRGIFREAGAETFLLCKTGINLPAAKKNFVKNAFFNLLIDNFVAMMVRDEY